MLRCLEEIQPTPLLKATIKEAARAADSAEIEQAVRDADAAEHVLAECVVDEVDAVEAIRVADKADFDFWVAAKVAAVKSPCTVRVRIYLVALLTAHFFVSGKMRGAAKRCGVVPGRCES